MTSIARTPSTRHGRSQREQSAKRPPRHKQGAAARRGAGGDVRPRGAPGRILTPDCVESVTDDLRRGPGRVGVHGVDMWRGRVRAQPGLGHTNLTH